jgi:Zn-dependent protease/predicted transcriptional regulator
VKWSWKLARVAGIDIYVHATFLLLLAWIALGAYQQGGAPAAINGVLFILAVFASVVLHEYGHALTARRFGVNTKDIILLPIGGVARLERMPDDPKQELLIAIAGPIVTIVLAVALYLALVVTHGPTRLNQILAINAPFLAQLMRINVWLAAFNLLPAFPMDGGRVLRAALAMRTDYVRATELAARIGKGFALLFGIVGLFVTGNPFLVLIALFVWLGAAGEATLAQTRTAFSGVPVERVMIRDVRLLSPNDTLATAVDHVLAGFQQDFPVVDDGTVVGVLTRADLLTALASHGRDARVGDVMQRRFVTAEPSDALDEAFNRLQGCKCHTLPVVRGRELVGVLTMENVAEFLMIESALRRQEV